MLDERGGPNHVGNFCSAPIHADTARGTLMHQSAYWVLGHFARFARPGAQRVRCVSSPEVESTAFVNPDESIVVVATNRHHHPLHHALRIDGAFWPCELPPRSIATFVAAAR